MKSFSLNIPHKESLQIQQSQKGRKMRPLTWLGEKEEWARGKDSENKSILSVFRSVSLHCGIHGQCKVNIWPNFDQSSEIWMFVHLGCFLSSGSMASQKTEQWKRLCFCRKMMLGNYSLQNRYSKSMWGFRELFYINQKLLCTLSAYVVPCKSVCFCSMVPACAQVNCVLMWRYVCFSVSGGRFLVPWLPLIHWQLVFTNPFHWKQPPLVAAALTTL